MDLNSRAPGAPAAGGVAVGGPKIKKKQELVAEPGRQFLTMPCCGKKRMLFRNVLEQSVSDIQRRAALCCTDLVECGCSQSCDSAEERKWCALGGREPKVQSNEQADLFAPLPEPLEFARTAEKRTEYDSVFDKLRWAGLDLVDRAKPPEKQRDEGQPHLGEPLRGARLVGYPAEVWERMQCMLRALEKRSTRRNRNREQYAKWWAQEKAAKRVQGADLTVKERTGQDWSLLCWTHEFLAKLNYKTYDTATIVYNSTASDMVGLPGGFEVKSAFLPLGLEDGGGKGAGPASDPNSFEADVKRLTDGAEQFAKIRFPAKSIQGFSLLQANDRGNKAAAGKMLMCGVCVTSSWAVVGRTDAGGNPLKHGELSRYKPNKSRDQHLENAAAAYSKRFARVEGLAVPRGAGCRLEIMETMDNGGEFVLLPGRTHQEFNGTHNITKTHGYVVMCHADSSCDGTLETILFYRPEEDPFDPSRISGKGSRPAPREDFGVGHGWFFMAGTIFSMPTTRGGGCLVWVASCNPSPLYHGTLPTYTSASAEKKSRNHDGMGSALLCQSNVVAAMRKKLGADLTEGLNNRKAKNTPASVPVCPGCGFLCRGACRRSGREEVEVVHQENSSKGSRDRGAAASSSASGTSAETASSCRAAAAPPGRAGPAAVPPAGPVPPPFRRLSGEELRRLPEGEQVAYLLQLSQEEERERQDFMAAIAAVDAGEVVELSDSESEVVELSDSESEGVGSANGADLHGFGGSFGVSADIQQNDPYGGRAQAEQFPAQVARPGTEHGGGSAVFGGGTSAVPASSAASSGPNPIGKTTNIVPNNGDLFLPKASRPVNTGEIIVLDDDEDDDIPSPVRGPQQRQSDSIFRPDAKRQRQGVGMSFEDQMALAMERSTQQGENVTFEKQIELALKKSLGL